MARPMQVFRYLTSFEANGTCLAQLLFSWSLQIHARNDGSICISLSDSLRCALSFIEYDTNLLSKFVWGVQNKLELFTGIPVQNQSIALYNAENDSQPLGTLEEEERQLGYYGIHDFQILKVWLRTPRVCNTMLRCCHLDYRPEPVNLTDWTIDGCFSSGQIWAKLWRVCQASRYPLALFLVFYCRLNSLFEIDTVLAYKQRNKIGRFAEKDSEEEIAQSYPQANIPVGARCEVETAEEGLHKRGTVRFVGPTQFNKTGVWVGIEYDEPMGKNDGLWVNSDLYSDVYLFLFLDVIPLTITVNNTECKVCGISPVGLITGSL